jgi:serine phosphatase RsbU (regulator of sigma subunit)
LLGGFVLNRLKISQKQKALIAEKKKEVDLALLSLEEKNKEITDSINYAKRIQSAILPSSQKLKEVLPNHFITYIPKDIVAGDFYWLQEIGNKILFAACDCTGHGVPGAMVSVVCNNGLNRSVKEFGLTDPAQILDKTRELVIEEFSKSDEEVKDGMDIALCSLEGSKLTFAGAHNPLWIIRNGTDVIEEIKGDKQPVGVFEKAKGFKSHEVSLEKGDTVYIFTDGYADQFGGDKGKKLKTANFKSLLLALQNDSMVVQKEKIQSEFDEWKGSLEQLDDVCIIGLRV